MVERQRADNDCLLRRLALGRVAKDRLTPGFGLQYVGKNVPMQQRGTFGDARRAARVLQECEIVVTQFRTLEWQTTAFSEDGGVFDRAGQTESRHHLLDMAHNKINNRALDQPQRLTHRRNHNMLDFGAGDNLLQGAGKVLQNEDCLRTGIFELMLQFARCVKRVHIDDDQPGAQDPGEHNRVLDDIGQHDCHAVAFLQPLGLQPCGNQMRG